MTRKLSRAGAYLLDAIERLDQKDYERLIGSGFKQLTTKDLTYLRDRATKELEIRATQSSPSCTPMETARVRGSLEGEHIGVSWR